MLFPTVRFAVFFVAAWAVLLALRGSPRWWRAALLAANWVFYATWDVTFTALLAASVLANHVVARVVAGGRSDRVRRAALVAGIAGNVAVLAVWKYFDFFSSSIGSALRRVGVEASPPVLDWVLPLGISFFTFQAVSYLVEVRWKAVDPAPLVDEAVWLSFFPTVVSGPITRASELLPQLATARTTAVDHAEAFLLVARGLFLKVAVASYLSTAIVDDVFAAPERYGAPDLLFAVYGFAALLYCDFSGYTDIARGCALLLGVRLPENFDAPYGATSVNRFWKRWHMTLSRWLRDFVFFPLGRRSGARRWATYRNTVLVMVVAGLWHGAAWTFVAFGAVHGLALAGERWWRDERRARGRRPRRGPAWTALSWFATFHVVALGWLFFRAESLGQAGAMLRRLVTAWGAPDALTAPVVLVVAAVVAVQLAPGDWWASAVRSFGRLAPAVQVACLAAALTAVDVLGPEGVAPFVYFGF